MITENLILYKNICNSRKETVADVYFFIPYVLVTGSRKRGIWGLRKVKIINKNPIKQMDRKAKKGDLQKWCSLNKSASIMNGIAVEMKNIAILIKSGVLPNTPLIV